jgi:MFS transporter, FHS family, glucose/mannose:H+ symporter
MPERQLASPSDPTGTDQHVQPNNSAAGSARSEWILLHLGFVAVGVITTLIGNVLPTFIRQWSLSDSQAGFLIGAQFSGSTIGTLLTSVLLPRFGFGRVLGWGFISFALGFAFFGLGPWYISALAVFVYGFGYGLVNPATNLRATLLPSKNMASAVSFLNFSWTIGAVSCPFVVGRSLPHIGVRGIAIALGVITCAIAALHFVRHSSAPEMVAERPTRPLSEWIRNLKEAPSIALLLVFFLYVGTEVATGNWVATEEKRLPGGSTIVLFLAPSFFYGLLLFGRAISPLLLRRLSTRFLSLTGLASAVLGLLIIILAHQPVWLFAGAAFAGLGCAPQYPIFVTWLAQTFGSNSTWLSSLFFGAAGAGGAVLPWLLGVVGTQTGSLRVGFVLPLLACVGMIVCALRCYPQKGGRHDPVTARA